MNTPRRLFRILFVCTGNICRSPMAERLMRYGLAQRLGEVAASFRIESAGTWGHEGSPMEPFAAQFLTERGASAEGFVARELTPEHVIVADLILAATRDHRDQVIAVDGYARDRTFTLLEFARLVRAVEPGSLPVGDPVARARTLVEAAARLRDIRPPVSPHDDDVHDPLGSPLHVYRVCGESIAAGLEKVLDALAVIDERHVV